MIAFFFTEEWEPYAVGPGGPTVLHFNRVYDQYVFAEAPRPTRFSITLRDGEIMTDYTRRTFNLLHKIEAGNETYLFYLEAPEAPDMQESA